MSGGVLFLYVDTKSRATKHMSLFQRLLEAPRPACLSVADYVRGPKATRGASVVGRGLIVD